jgi:hypothetical protein
MENFKIKFVVSFIMESSFEVKVSGGNGSSIEEAIQISNCNNSEGVKAEYEEIRKRYGKCRLVKQMLIGRGGRMYDKICIENEGKVIDTYFDITEFFGKF